MRRIAHALAAAAVAASSVALVASPSSAKVSPATADPHSIKTSSYVALGDSYSSAAGVLPQVEGAPLGCSRSEANYAHDIASALHPTSFTDVTCSGAKTQDFYTAQSISPAGTSVPPQLDALSPHTRLVTMTIGGNDENVFVNSFFGCVLLANGNPTGSPCKNANEDKFNELIRTQTYPNLVRALTAVRHEAPAATVVILGYPTILPAHWSQSCFPVMPLAEGDVPWLYAQQQLLNDTIRKAAEVTGARYVDMSAASVGHDACQPVGTRWIEPALGTISAFPVHPNATGEAAMATQTLDQLGLSATTRR